MPDAGGSGRGLEAHYRPQLDGLRGVAVYLVVAFHAGISAFSGGFIGVDVFFVLSGYLVTQLLLRDIRADGRINFRRFYSRRFRRLLPAAFVVLIVTAVVYAAVAAPSDVQDAIGAFRAAFLYVANWHFIEQSSDYFAATVDTNPVLHFWSLAVEEQFYLCWPLLLSGAYVISRRAGARQWKTLRLIVAAGFVLSLVAALYLSTRNLNRAYYGTDTRAYELLAGALLAMTPRVMTIARQRRRLVQALAPLELAVLVLIATSTIHLGAIQRGVAATIITFGLIVALEASKGGIVTRMLSTPSAVYLGRVSYGTYLWHWPVILIVSQRFQPNAVSLFALTCLVATGLASLSYEILEQPVRLSRLLDRHRSRVIAIGLVTSFVGGLVLVPAIMEHDERTAATSAALLGEGPASRDFRLESPEIDLETVQAHSYGRRNCFGKPVEACIIVPGSGLRIMLIGDSNAIGLIPALAELARQSGFSFVLGALARCPWQHGLVEIPESSPADTAQACRDEQDDWYDRLVPELDPDVIVLLHRTMDDPGGDVDLDLDGKVLHPRTADYTNAVREIARDTVNELATDGRKVVVVEPLPLSPNAFNPTNCLSEAKYVEDCRYVAASTTPNEKYYRTLANGKDVFTLDLDRLICPYHPICDPIVRGVVVKRDKQHISAAYSKTLAAPIGYILAANGIIPRVP